MNNQPFSAIRLSDVLNHAIAHVTRPITDEGIVLKCVSCAKEVAASDCKITLGADTVYSCPTCQSILVVLVPYKEGKMGKKKPGGYRLGDFKIQNEVDLICKGSAINKAQDILFPAYHSIAGKSSKQ